MRSGFRSSIFDPVLVVAQIVSLFCFHCVALGGWLLLANLVGGTSTTIDQLFDYHEFEGTYDGWLVMGAVSLNSFTTALIMWKIVRRAKQVFIQRSLICFVCFVSYLLQASVFSSVWTLR
ncbi:Protein SYS1 homolog [Geodia barretti]|uniref:Protein SYS1 homolog n=1 Tax=Geodia barretti TaxID=519541 RepID=A0AA35QW01_GEOBA|nr:Protein SYS1 homolog [Geodia barretti]